MPSPRKLCILRFWNRLDLAMREADEITDWLNEWHNATWDDEPALRRVCAWELFKIEHPEFEEDEPDPESIPLGIGDEYLRKVAALEQQYGVDALECLRDGEMPS